MEGIKSNIKNTQITTILLQHNPIPAEVVLKIEKFLELLSKQRKAKEATKKDQKPATPGLPILSSGASTANTLMSFRSLRTTESGVQHVSMTSTSTFEMTETLATNSYVLPRTISTSSTATINQVTPRNKVGPQTREVSNLLEELEIMSIL
jgi:hypothetical protein